MHQGQLKSVASLERGHVAYLHPEPNMGAWVAVENVVHTRESDRNPVITIYSNEVSLYGFRLSGRPTDRHGNLVVCELSLADRVFVATELHTEHADRIAKLDVIYVGEELGRVKESERQRGRQMIVTDTHGTGLYLVDDLIIRQGRDRLHKLRSQGKDT